MSELKDLLAIAERTAAAAGVALKAHRAQWAVVKAEHGREVKIDADKRSEDIILRALGDATVFPVISEEAGWVRATQRGDRYVWVVDPLDGSVNYLRDYPHCAVSIALLDAGAPVLGVVDCFVLDERFTGIVGEGAWLNGAAIKVSEIDDPAGGILQTGVPSQMQLEAMKLFEQRLKTWRKVRMIGSAATALAYVAAGRAEAYRESGSMIWDVAGGCALVQAAGGKIRIDGPSLDKPLEVAAANARVALPE